MLKLFFPTFPRHQNFSEESILHIRVQQSWKTNFGIVITEFKSIYGKSLRNIKITKHFQNKSLREGGQKYEETIEIDLVDQMSIQSAYLWNPNGHNLVNTPCTQNEKKI